MLMRSDRPVALQWVGHGASDEMTALLGAMRAKTWDEFHAAPPRLCRARPDHGGGGGGASRARRADDRRAPAAAGERAPMPGLVQAPGTMWALDDLVPGADFFSVGNDPIASANDRPAEATVPIGFFFAPPERVERLRTLLQQAPLRPDDMRALPLDLLHPRALAMRDVLLARMPAGASDIHRVLAAWDGRYDAGSQGALVFEVLVAALAKRLVRRAHARGRCRRSGPGGC